MEIAIVPAGASRSLSLSDLSAAGKAILAGNVTVKTTEAGAQERGSAVFDDKGDVLVFAHAVLCHDRRVKITFSRPDNPYADAVILLKDFNAERAFSAAVRILIGCNSNRLRDFSDFRSKARVDTLVRREGVSGIAKALPRVFSDFMFAVRHDYNRALGKDPTEAIMKLRTQVRELIPHLSEGDLVQIYREEVVDWVGKR